MITNNVQTDLRIHWSVLSVTMSQYSHVTLVLALFIFR